MRVTYNWLKQFLPDLHASPEKVAEILTFIGFEVERFEKIGSDWAYDVDVTSNRPDCLSALGLARELGAAVKVPLKTVEVSPPFSDTHTTELTSVEVVDTELCPHYSAHLILGVEVKPSPKWLIDALSAIGVRPVNNVVDATNFVTMELGQPLHAFDFDHLYERRIVVRPAKSGEEIRAIDGRIYTLNENMLVIADAKFPVAIAGVMGGKDTEVTEQTRNILLESALFEPVNIRRTSKALNLVTAASYRFSRGVDPEMVVPAARRAAQLILQIAGGSLAKDPINIRHHPPKRTTVSMRFPRIEKIMGIHIPPEEAIETLMFLGFAVVERDDNKVTVEVPSWRGDVEREIDLIEEVARIHGFGDVPFVETTVATVRLPRKLRLERRIRDIMAACGFLEAMSDVFVEQNESGLFAPFGGQPVSVRNPIRADSPNLRASLIPTLLSTLRHNQHHANSSPDLFELSSVFCRHDGETFETRSLCAISCHSFERVKGVLEEVCRRLHITVQTMPEDVKILEKGASGVLKLGKKRVGICGMLSDA
ncbi:MAG: phenylalanine--tRNA ligase subunit beta, partial [Planctomycetota bacterium]